MLLTRVFGSSADPEKRLKALTVTSLTGAIGVLLLLAITLYLVFSEVVDNNARSAALENSTNLVSSSTSLSERINLVSSDVGALDSRLDQKIEGVSSDVDALDNRSTVLDQRIEDVDGKATTASMENATTLATLATTVTDQSEQIFEVMGEMDTLNTTAKVLEEQIRAAGSEARSAAVDASSAVITLSTSLSGLTEKAVLVSHDVDALKFDSTTLEDRLRDVQRELDALYSDFRDLKQRFDQRR